MTSASWTPVRLVRWPAQERDRQWCETRGLPRVLLVEDGQPAPEARSREVVLPATAGESEIAAAVDLLAYGGDGLRTDDWRAARSALPAARPRAARVSPVAAAARLIAAF